MPRPSSPWPRAIALNHLRQDWRRRQRLVPLDLSRPLPVNIAPDLTWLLSEELEAVLPAEVRAVVRLRADGYGVGAGLSVAAMSVAVLRYVLWRPNWLATEAPAGRRRGR